MRLSPLDPGEPGRRSLPAPVEPEFRGVAIHWVTTALPSRGRRRRLAPTVPIPTWAVQRVSFRALSADGSSTPPSSDTQLGRYVRRAYAFAASHHPIPSDAEVLYEVRR